MAQEFAKSFYASKAWHKCRASYIASRRSIDGGLCELCQSTTGYIIHHKIVLNPQNINDPDISLNHKRLMYVCKDCHEKLHAKEEVYITPMLQFDHEGNPIRPDSPHD